VANAAARVASLLAIAAIAAVEAAIRGALVAVAGNVADLTALWELAGTN